MHSVEHPEAAGVRVLIAEDDTSARTGLIELVKAWGFDTIGAVDGEDALEQITAQRPDIVLADLVMPRRDGLSLLRALSDHLSELTFVMLTAQGSVEGAVAAMKDGAYDYLTKPIDPQRLRVLLEKLVERHDSQREVAALKRELVTDGRLGQIVGKSAAIRKVYRLVEQAAPTPASVLIYGESGTGKELVAAAIHMLSPRASSPFVAINCAAIPEGLLESEIFGHERGAFTGAISQRQGCFELAHRGTLFLDEVAEMAPLLQAKLLRVSGPSVGSAARVITPSTCGSSPRPTPSRRRPSKTVDSAMICTTGSTSSRSRCRPCANVLKTCRSWCRPSSRSSVDTANDR